MLKKIIMFTMLITFASCSFNKDAANVNNRRVVYSVKTVMSNVELVVDYYVGDNISKTMIVDKLPWDVEAHISPFSKIEMSGYLRYKDESKPVSNYIDIEFMIDVDNEYLNKSGEISVESVEAGFTGEDLKKLTKFNLQIDPIE